MGAVPGGVFGRLVCPRNEPPWEDDEAVAVDNSDTCNG